MAKNRTKSAESRLWCFGLLVDRIEQAIDDGRIAVDDVDDIDPTPLLSLDQLDALLKIIAPEVYADPTPGSTVPLESAPASARRVFDYADRRRRGQPLFDPRDATADGPGVVVPGRRNGWGPKAGGGVLTAGASVG